MKVFELMNLLSSSPAGANVKVRHVMTVEELVKNDAIPLDDELGYQLDKNPDSVEEVTEDNVCIYLD